MSRENREVIKTGLRERERVRALVCTLWQFDETNNFEKRFPLFKNSFIIYFIINEDDHHASSVMSIKILG